MKSRHGRPPHRLSSHGSSPATASLWIIDPFRDFLLIVGAPLIILPAIWAVELRFRPEQIYLFVGSFGAVGHHLPGMMRAYGDRYLFDRFSYRFLLTPLLLGAVCVLFAVRELNAMVLVAYVWGVWHGLMQTYGFLRIYDAKAGAAATDDRAPRFGDVRRLVRCGDRAVADADDQAGLTDYYQRRRYGRLAGDGRRRHRSVDAGHSGRDGGVPRPSALRLAFAASAQSPAKLVLMAVELRLLVVQQRRRLQHAGRDRAVRNLSRRAVPDDRLDLQSQSRRSQSGRRPVHALPVPSQLEIWPACMWDWWLLTAR